jgi:hypothetical protein
MMSNLIIANAISASTAYLWYNKDTVSDLVHKTVMIAAYGLSKTNVSKNTTLSLCLFSTGVFLFKDACRDVSQKKIIIACLKTCMGGAAVGSSIAFFLNDWLRVSNEFNKIHCRTWIEQDPQTNEFHQYFQTCTVSDCSQVEKVQEHFSMDNFCRLINKTGYEGFSTLEELLQVPYSRIEVIS